MRKAVIYSHYILYEDGRVYSTKRRGSTGHFVSVYVDVHGYKTMSLWINNAQKGLRVHRELAKAFIPNPNEYRCVNHKDGNKLNNDISNLEWCTHSQNNQHAYDTGLRVPRTNTGHKYIHKDGGRYRVKIKKVRGKSHQDIKSALKERDIMLAKYAR